MQTGICDTANTTPSIITSNISGAINHVRFLGVDIKAGQELFAGFGVGLFNSIGLDVVDLI
jgi:hypothetical protein